MARRGPACHLRPRPVAPDARRRVSLPPRNPSVAEVGCTCCVGPRRALELRRARHARDSPDQAIVLRCGVVEDASAALPTSHPWRQPCRCVRNQRQRVARPRTHDAHGRRIRVPSRGAARGLCCRCCWSASAVAQSPSPCRSRARPGRADPGRHRVGTGRPVWSPPDSAVDLDAPGRHMPPATTAATHTSRRYTLPAARSTFGPHRRDLPAGRRVHRARPLRTGYFASLASVTSFVLDGSAPGPRRWHRQPALIYMAAEPLPSSALDRDRLSRPRRDVIVEPLAGTVLTLALEPSERSVGYTGCDWFDGQYILVRRHHPVRPSVPGASGVRLSPLWRTQQHAVSAGAR